MLTLSGSDFSNMDMTTNVWTHQWNGTSPTTLAVTNTSAEPYTRPFDVTGVIMTCVVLLPLAIFGIAANVLTIVVIMTSLKLKASVFNHFIVSLCVSDLTSAIISPLFAYRRTWGFDFWAWSDFLCKMAWGLDIWTSIVTSTHIVLFAMLRYTSVQWPHRFSSIKSKQAAIAITIVWFCAFFVGFVPFVIWFGATRRDRSDPSPTSKWPSCTLNANWIPQFKMFTYVGYTLMFYVPFAIVIVLSVLIGIRLYMMRKARENNVTKAKRFSSSNERCTLEEKRRRKENQIILQLVLIVGSYLFGYIPQTVFHYYTLSNPALTQAEKEKDWILGSIVYMMLRFSESLNPVFYNLASSKMRHETKRTLRKICRKLRCCAHHGDANLTTSGTGLSSSAGNQLQL